MVGGSALSPPLRAITPNEPQRAERSAKVSLSAVPHFAWQPVLFSFNAAFPLPHCLIASLPCWLIAYTPCVSLRVF